MLKIKICARRSAPRHDAAPVGAVAAVRPDRNSAVNVKQPRPACLVIIRTIRVMPVSAAFCSKLPSVRPPTVTAAAASKNQRALEVYPDGLAKRLVCGME